MADFVAVIRRAVDGLAENTPDNRARVYDKARGAVRRQLESMSPAPPEELVEKQLDKLESAISEVDLEHAEALPGDEDEGVEGFASYFSEPGDEPAAEVSDERPVDDERETGGEDAILPPQTHAVPDPEAPSSPEGAPFSQAGSSGWDDPWEFGPDRSVGPGVSAAGASDLTGDPSREHEDEPEPLPVDPDADFPPPPRADSPSVQTTGAARGPAASRRRKSRSGKRSAVLAIIVILILGGGAYAFWTNRDAVSDMVADLTGSGTQSASLSQNDASEPAISPSTATQTEDASTDDAGNGSATGGNGAGGDTGEDAASPATEPSSPDASSSDDAAGAEELPDGGKFTQRLLADGSETNPGPASSDEPSSGEGRSVSEQSDAATDDTGEAAAGPAGSGETTGQEGAQDADQPAVSQKMYLYEERFENKAPAAISGSIVWSVEKESPGGDVLPEPAIHGEISLPERGVTALMTIKRNADSSLPASHLIEIVFALPDDFPGGGIDNVQRVSFKQTEQARGDPLISVPAKITDDFFMVALNDYPQAVETNLNLLKSRNWIDIPITYSNGRRALLTLEKGSSGTQVFDEVMQAWGADDEASAPDTPAELSTDDPSSGDTGTASQDGRSSTPPQGTTGASAPSQ